MKTKNPTKKEIADATQLLERVSIALHASGADGRLLSALISRCCSGMDDGDRFYNDSDDTWWEWRQGRLYASGPPIGYGKTGSACVLCRRGFPIKDGSHYGSAKLGRIPWTECTDKKPRRRTKVRS